jgi:hypothetical protein
VKFVAAAVAAAACAALPLAAQARATATLDSTDIRFFADTLSLVARTPATLRLIDGTRASGDAAFVDLKNDRAIVTGHARVSHGSTTLDADAVAIDLDSNRIDLLDVTTGVRRTTRLLGTGAHAEIDAQRFAFPDVDDRYAYIRSHHAAITPRADVRFAPASFPTSVGAFPVPSYLYSFATAAGFGESTLPGATFDQPYGIVGTPTSLTSIHGRYETSGPAVALQEQLASGDRAYATGGIDVPFRDPTSMGVNAYTRLGSRYTFLVDANSVLDYREADATLGAAFGRAGGRLTYHLQSGGYSTFDASLRSPDTELGGGFTGRLTADMGYDAFHGGDVFPYSYVPDSRAYATVWRHGLDAFLSSPVAHLPLGTTVSFTFDAARTWYAFPRHTNTITAAVSASKKLTRAFLLSAGYQNAFTSQIFPNRQSVFFPVPTLPLLAPDGTPYYGWDAYDGATVARYVNLDLQYAPPSSSTSIRVSLRHADDFFQFDGIGRPPWELHADAQFRPFPNIGIALGRSYDFGWGGTRFVPGWNFAITP